MPFWSFRNSTHPNLHALTPYPQSLKISEPIPLIHIMIPDTAYWIRSGLAIVEHILSFCKKRQYAKLTPFLLKIVKVMALGCLAR
jgi:hypothetical protein